MLARLIIGVCLLFNILNAEFKVKSTADDELLIQIAYGDMDSLIEYLFKKTDTKDVDELIVSLHYELTKKDANYYAAKVLEEIYIDKKYGKRDRAKTFFYFFKFSDNIEQHEKKKILKEKLRLVNEIKDISSFTKDDLDWSIHEIPVDVLDTMVKYGVKFDIDKVKLDKSALMYAISKNDYEKVKWLLAHGTDINMETFPSSFKQKKEEWEVSKKIYDLLSTYEDKIKDKRTYYYTYCNNIFLVDFDKKYQPYCKKFAQSSKTENQEALSIWFYLLGGDVDTTIKLGKELMENNRNYNIASYMGYAYFINGDTQKAKEYYKKYIDNSDDVKKGGKSFFKITAKTELEQIKSIYSIDIKEAKRVIDELLEESK